MSHAVPVLMFLALAATGPVLALANARAPGPGPVLVLVPPWRDSLGVLARAGGSPVGPAVAPFALLAAGDGADFPRRLRRAGAWGVLDGTRLGALCGG